MLKNRTPLVAFFLYPGYLQSGFPVKQADLPVPLACRGITFYTIVDNQPDFFNRVFGNTLGGADIQ